jgi:hypothetical protein
VYVDDIVFGGSSHTLVVRFAEDMSKEFEVLSWALDQEDEGGSLSASSQVHEGHPQEVQDGRLEAPVDTDEYDYNTRRDEDGEPVDQKEYRSMISSLLYLTTTRPDIQFSVCLCTRFQALPRTSHRQGV